MNHLFHKALKKYRDLSIQGKAAIWFLICSFMQKGISVIATPIFTRLMSTDDYGRYSVFDSWMGIIGAIVILTLPYGVTEQGLIKFSDRRPSFLSSLVGLMTMLILAWSALYLAVGRGLIDHLLKLTTLQMICMFIMLWATSVFNFWAILQRVEYKYKRLVALTIFTSIAKLLVSIILIQHSQDKATARILGLTLVEFVAYIGLFGSIMRNGKSFYHRSNWAYALGFNIPLIPHYLSQRILNASDRIMIQQLISYDAAGIYSLAYSISSLLILLNTSVLNAIGPWMFQNIKEKRFQELKRIVYPTMLLIGICNLLLVCVAPEVVKFFAPSKYYDAIWIIPPVAISGLFQYSYSVFVNFEFYYEKKHFISIATIVGAILNIVLNYIFIPIFGYYAAGYTTLVCFMIYAIGHYIFMNVICKSIDEKPPFNTKLLIVMSAVFVAVSIGISFTYNYPIVRYGIVIIGLLMVLMNWKKIQEMIRIVKK